MSLFLVAVIGSGIFAVLSMRVETMPADKQAYWNWVGSINRGAEAALEPGLELLETYPELQPLYLRLARLCLDNQREALCRDAFLAVQAPTSLSRLYKKAALTLLDRDEAVTPWQQLARAPDLDPTLARLIVQQTWPEAVETVKAIWHHQLGLDSMAVGAAFGLGYAAVLRSDWGVGTAMLNRAAALSPHDPQIYREFGRIYYFKGEPDSLERVLELGIEAAHIQHDLEQELILRGNLGWTLIRRNGELSKAEALITEALDQSRRLSDETTEGYNLYRLANVYLQQNRFDEAVPVVRAAEALYAQHVPAHHAEVVALHGLLLSSMMRFSDAEQVLEQAISEAEVNHSVVIKVESLVSLARLRLQTGRYADVQELGREALALARHHELREQEVWTRLALGDAERHGGNYDAAGEHYRRVVALAQHLKSTAHLSDAYNGLGQIALDLRDEQTAKIYFEQMLRAVEETGHATRMAEAYRGLAITYARIDNPAEALHYYDQALALDRVQALTRADILIAKAWMMLDRGRYEEAEALFNEALRTEPASLSVAYRVELGLGDAAFSRGTCGAALDHFRRAEAIQRRKPIPALYWYALFGRALTQWCLGKKTEAEAAFTEAIGVVEAVRGGLHASSHRATFVQNKVRVYEYFASFLEEQGRTREAFHILERARSRSLVDLLYTAQQERRPDMTRATDRAVELDRRLRAISLKISDDAFLGDSAGYLAVRSAQLLREYQRTDSAYRQVQAILAKERPIYTFNPLPEDAARATLEAGEAMIVYDVRRLGVRGRETEASVAYVVLPDRVVSVALTLQSNRLAASIQQFREALGTVLAGPGEGWEPMARRLYQSLVAPVVAVLPATVKHLHLVPEGVLYYLPFATLQDEAGRFLVERFTLSVTPSASILKLSRDRNPRRWHSMLLLADPDGNLPGARREVAAIAGLGTAGQHVVLAGKTATRENLEQVAGQVDVVHLATHGQFVSHAPWHSHLELYGGEALTVEEISRLTLNAYLVTLSACETALSGGVRAEVPTGEEWVGLNQAFLAAGTPTVMASLWAINDRVSSDFMIAFYQALGPAGKAMALADVQRQFIRDARTRHPFYWAPFTLMGDPL